MTLLQTYSTQAEGAKDMLKNVEHEVSVCLQQSIKQYSILFSDKDSMDALIEKTQSLERRISGLLKQVKTINQDLHEIYTFFKRQEGGNAQII